MDPLQIRISDVIARSSDEKHEVPGEPQIAYLRDGAIYIDELSRKTLAEIDVSY
jgi:septum formation inhibitor MinC